ncbi:MAG: MFS transporter [SAR324 cluster bacterium]|nr:MFS transporter [SAR324 cluster bacterium]
MSSQISSTVGYIQLIRENRNFRFLWLGQIVSLLGDWFNLIASASLIAMLTDSGLAIGALFVVRMLAPFLVSPIAGVFADRYNRKQILIVTDIARALVVFCLLFVRDSGQVWLLYVLTAMQLGISGFFFPTRTAILPDITTKDELGTANTISSITWSVMLALGAALGGLVSGTWGIYPAFIIDACTFLLSAIFILQINLTHMPVLDASQKTVSAAFEQYLDGLRYLRRKVDVLVICLHKPAQSLMLFSGIQIAQVAIAEEVFVLGEGGGIGLGLMYGATGLGTGIGPVIARQFTGDRDRDLRLALFMGYLIGGLGLALVAPLFNFGMVLFGTFLRGVGGGIIWVFSTQLLLHQVPGQVRGRVFSTEFALFTLMGAAGSAIAGVILDPLGITNMIWLLAGISSLPALLWLLWLKKKR